MKQFKIFNLLLISILLSFQGCHNEEIISSNETIQEDVTANRGKPQKGGDYNLAEEPTPIQIYGVWHCGDDYCTWTTPRDISEFDAQNHWIIDRGDGEPSVNLVVLSFVNPLDLLNETTNSSIFEGVPRGMTQEVVSYFKNEGIRVMLSIGGFTYVDDWNTALSQDAWQLGLNAAKVANNLGVGIEIDYEENTDPNLIGLESFITAYRSVIPYDASGNNHSARLTIDLAAGDRWLIDICRKATADWLAIDNPVLDYANAMVPARQPSVSSAIANWDEHIDGKPQYGPPILPLAPCKFTGSLYLTGRKAVAECSDFSSSVHNATQDYVTRINPNGAGTTSGMLGYMFWAAECPSTRASCATDCRNGIGEGSKSFNIPIPMPSLRQE